MGFFEILLIVVVTLLVVGPEKMPEAIRSVALVIGRVKRSFAHARQEVEAHIGFDEVRDQLNRESVVNKVNKINHNISDLDQKISTGEHAMPWTEDEYKALQTETIDSHENNKPSS